MCKPKVFNARYHHDDEINSAIVQALTINQAEDDRTRTRRMWAVTIAIGGLVSVLAGIWLSAGQFNDQFGQNQKSFDAQTDAFSAEAADRKDASMIRAWQVLTDAQKNVSNRGQITALQRLFHGGEILRKVDFGCPNGHPSGKACIFLEGVDLTPNSKMKSADLKGSNFERARLGGAKFPGANLSTVNFKEAALSNADLSRADLTGAILVGTVLENTIVTGANFTNTRLDDAVLTNVIGLTQAQLNKACANKTPPNDALPKDSEGKQLVWNPRTCP